MTDQQQTPHDARPSSDLAPPVEKSTNDSAKIGHQQRTKWLAGIGFGGLTFFALIVCCAFVFMTAWPAFSELMNTMTSKISDEDFAKLLDALSKRAGRDADISSISADFIAFGGEATEVWLFIDITYTGTCDSTTNDLCEALVDEFARIVFDNYPRVDELDEIEVSITHQYSRSFIDLSITPVDKALTVEEWRKELSIED